MFNLKLKENWVLWEKRISARKQSFKDLNRKISTISDIRSLIQIWRELCLNKICDFLSVKNSRDCVMLFKEGINPIWEDLMNRKGGHF